MHSSTRVVVAAALATTLLGACTGAGAPSEPAAASPREPTSTTTTGERGAVEGVGGGRGDGREPYVDAQVGDAAGDLVSAIERVRPDVPQGAQAWDVEYLSEGVDGELTTVTGVVFAPDGDGDGERPVLSWAHGSTGVADGCAPSYTATTVPGLSGFLDAGYVVAATDYEGLGTEAVHPYLVGDSAGRSVLDAARAARRVPGAGAGRSATTVVYGHSQGGHAALFAAELAPSYAPELSVAGVVAAAPPINLPDLLSLGSTPFGFGFLISAAVGYVAAYPELALNDILTEQGVEASEIVEEVCLPSVIRRFLADPVDTWLAQPPLGVASWSERISENIPAVGATPVPTLVVQGDLDAIVPAVSTQAGVDDLCADGAEIDLRRYPDADHSSVLGQAEAEVLEWLADRVAGRRVSDTCR